MQTKLWFTQSLNKSQISQFNIGGGDRTNKWYISQPNKTWQDLIDYEGTDEG